MNAHRRSPCVVTVVGIVFAQPRRERHGSGGPPRIGQEQQFPVIDLTRTHPQDGASELESATWRVRLLAGMVETCSVLGCTSKTMKQSEWIRS